MKLNIYGPNLRDQSKGTFVVHAASCRDCGKLRGEVLNVADCATICDAVRVVYQDQINEGMPIEDGINDMHFAPCVTLPVS